MAELTPIGQVMVGIVNGGVIGDVESPRMYVQGEGGDTRPDPKHVRGACPFCGEPIVSTGYFVNRGGKSGYIIKWECWASMTRGVGMQEPPACTYFKIL